MKAQNTTPPKIPNNWEDNRTLDQKKETYSATPADHFKDPGRGIRLQKVMAKSECGSRRTCENLILEGAVRVNGHLVQTMPAWVDPAQDVITVNGRRLPQTTPSIYVMLYKPRGTVTTSHDPEGRTTVCDLIRHPSKKRLYPVGRLDADSSGLILMTNDGELANRITHPRYGLIKEYEVTVRGEIDEKIIKKLRDGIFLPEQNLTKSRKTKKSTIKIKGKSRERTHLQIKLHEGRNRQIRRMLVKIGHPVHRLKRTNLGPLKLQGLQPGQWRDLFPQEVAALRRSCSIPYASQ